MCMLGDGRQGTKDSVLLRATYPDCNIIAGHSIPIHSQQTEHMLVKSYNRAVQAAGLCCQEDLQVHN
jgi:hypothetical protein